MDYYERENWHREQVQNLVKEYELRDFQYLLQICTECMKTVDTSERYITRGIEYSIKASSKD